MTNTNVWVVRGGDNNELASQVKAKECVAISFGVGVDMSRVTARDELRELMEEFEPGTGTPNRVGQMFRFAREIRVEDFVLTPQKSDSTIHVSRCSGPYRFDPTVFGEEYPHVLPVNYSKTIPRSVFPQSIRNTLGSVLTVFRADTALPYLQEALTSTIPGGRKLLAQVASQVEPDPELLADVLEAQASGRILEAMDDIEHHDFQLFVAGILEAIGYKVRVGQKGKDGGVDILAFPDQFGLATPRIKVQVKNQKSSAGHQEVGYLNGVVGTGERGLFVCTGGFTKDAQNATFVRDGRIALVDGKELLQLLLEGYEAMPSRAKALLPLRRIYVPE